LEKGDVMHGESWPSDLAQSLNRRAIVVN